MSPDDPNTNGWDEYQKLILFRLDKLQSQIDEIEERLDEVTAFELDRPRKNTPDRADPDEAETTDEIDETAEQHTDQMSDPQGETPGEMLRQQSEDLP